MSAQDDRLDEILEVLMAYARQDFSPRLAISERRDEIDAIATGINLLAEELDGEVASRRELEHAYARLQDTQSQLVVAEKLAAVGQLANGVAHELNNPASWVLLGLEASRRRIARLHATPPSELARELAALDDSLGDVQAGMERIRSVLGDLRSLAPFDADRPVAVDLDEIVRAACHLARPAYHSVAELQLALGGVPPVVGDRGRLGQLVTNLVTNAAYAVAERPGQHVITIATSFDDDSVLLVVEDTGAGIPEALRERVFDPYFTTKSAEVGTGLGLAIVRKIAERYGGSVRATSGAGGGARIEVRLPPAARSPIATVPITAEQPAVSVEQRARILVIDDEPMLLRSIEQVLLDDHDVVTALGGSQALELLARDRAFDLVLCDLQMPEVDGVAVYEALRTRDPALLSRFVVMSGGAVTPRAAQFLAKTRPRSVGKPIDLDAILALAAAAIRRAA